MMPKLFMILLGSTPPGRNTEQHDMFFAVAHELKDLVPDIYAFWPEAGKKIHIDAWREVNVVDNFKVSVVSRIASPETPDNAARLFFINLGGYKRNEFDEFHYKLLAAGTDKGVTIKQAKNTAFYRHFGFKGATSHIDDKFGIDVDDIYEIRDILPGKMKHQYTIHLEETNEPLVPDEMHLGYTILEKLLKSAAAPTLKINEDEPS